MLRDYKVERNIQKWMLGVVWEEADRQSETLEKPAAEGT